MAVPPQILRIKRKRVDEPVNALYLETDTSQSTPQSKRRVTAQNYIFQRIQDSYDQACAPIDRPVEANASPPAAATAEHSETAAVMSEVLQRPSATSKTPSAARRFYIAGSPSKRKSSAPHTLDGPVFIEEGSEPTTSYAISEEKRQKLNEGRSQKRPGAASRLNKPKDVEARWENATNTRYSEKEKTGLQERDEQLKNAMLRFAADEDDLPQDTKKSMSGTDQKSSTALDAMDLDDTVTTAAAADADADLEQPLDQDDYVYDTFIRQPSNTALPSKNIGCLVVPPSDPTFWSPQHLLLSNSPPSEPDWDSEQDDENAENYYGADYPEEEVESDDEFRRDAYGDGKESEGEEWLDEGHDDFVGRVKGIDLGDGDGEEVEDGVMVGTVDSGEEDEEHGDSEGGDDDMGGGYGRMRDMQAYQNIDALKLKVLGAQPRPAALAVGVQQK